MTDSYDRPLKPSPFIFYFWPLLLLAGALIFLAWRFWPEAPGLNPDAQPRIVTPRGDLKDEEKTNNAIYEQASPSVVYVTNLSEQRNRFTLDLQQIPQGTGSGFVWDEDGHIVTNYHVIAGADAARVTLADHSSYEARKIWVYPDKDIAVLTIKAPKSKLRPILIGASHDLKVGQITYAIGNPFGLDQTMTVGIVSALGREVQSVNGHTIQGVIQTSAAINPGNSGGPLLDSAGRLIGMNTAIISPSGTFAGIGFAIPVDEINQIVPQLIRSGKVARPRLGVSLRGVEQGALIIYVVPESPAALAGLKGTRRDANGDIVLGDIIVAIDDKRIANLKDLHSALDHYKVGDTITVGILRDKQRQDVKITLQE